MINPIRVRPGLNKTNNNWFMGTNKTEDPRRGVVSGDTPTIPTNDFRRIHEETNGVKGKNTP